MQSKKRILVVDDDPDILDQVSLVLSGAGYEVVCAAGRQEAEDAILSARPDLAVVDLMMEEMDAGFVLCHEIKRVHPGTPVVLLTAVRSATGLSFAPYSDEAKAWMGADKALDKPVRPEQILAEVRRLLGEVPAPAAHGAH